ncbi:MAG: TonB-dependent receptor [Opitutae bacterium]|nr:TonB-dependent receptor [Opitutae bacterium]
MTNHTQHSCYRLFPRLLRQATSLFLALVAASATLLAAETGNISGFVTSKGTKNALQGATVKLLAFDRQEQTDNTGSFLISQISAGAVDLVVSYSGFEDQRITVTVKPGETTTTDIEMKASEVLVMDAFTVASVKEGQALAVTEQRNALNVKNVTALDEWGILPTQNVGELVSRMPGITYTTDEDNLINNVSIGGMPGSYTRLNIDGMSSTGVGGDGRTATLHSFSGSMYEQIEIIAGQTPDKRADSLGGQLNLKTKSPLAMAERRRIGYTASGRYFPSWSKRNAAVAERPLRPDFNVSYTEVFDVAGGRRNLGIVVSGSYQEIMNPHDWDIMLYESTTNPVAQLRDYTRMSGFNDRFISAISARADYRLSPKTTVSLRFLYNAGSEPFFNYTAVNPWVSTNLTVNDGTPATATGAIKAGYTAKRIEILPVANTTLQPGGVAVGAAQMRLNPQEYSFTSKNPTGTLLFEHNFGRLKIDHAYRWSNTHWESGAGRERENGTIALRTKDPIGFTLDISDLRGNVFNQTAGPSVYDIASYTPFVITAANATTQPVPVTSAVFTKRDLVTDTNEVSGNINASYNFETKIPFSMKVGIDTINRRVNGRNILPRRWYQLPGTVLPTNALMTLTEFERQNGGRRLPVVDPSAISTTLNNPALWYEDVNFSATQPYSGRYIMEEGVDSAYIQGQAKFGRLTLLAGIRGEWVGVETFTYLRARTTPIASEPNHFKRAAMDFAQQSRDGDYHKYFPSFHAAYDISSNLKLRSSWSTSYGRPRRQDIVPTPSVSDSARTVTVGNAALRPQMAKNIDLKLEYYLKDGMFSVRGYRKKITDYIGSTSRSGFIIPEGNDNGFDGLYAGYEIIQATNLGNATLKGVEFDFRKQLTFLPGSLRGLTVRANYTYLETEGRFAGTVNLKTGQIAEFVPRAYNASLLYIYKKFGASFDLNYTGKYPITYSTTSPNSVTIRDELLIMNAGFTYKIRPDATLFLNVNNIAEKAPRRYTFMESRTRSQWVTPRTLKFGITGQF